VWGTTAIPLPSFNLTPPERPAPLLNLPEAAQQRHHR
jgi:hypothetical protein